MRYEWGMSTVTASARALAAALADETLGPKIRARIHRVSLSRYVHGHRRPDIDTAKFLEDESGGSISMAGWAVPLVLPAPKRRRRASHKRAA